MTRLARERLTLAGGTELAYAVAGDRSADAVLLLHGIPSSADVFRGIVDELAKVAYVIAPDMPGAGESEPLPDTTFATCWRICASGRATSTCTTSAHRSAFIWRCANRTSCAA